MNGLNRCQQCAASLAGQAIGGLCANCLLKLALETHADPTAAADAPGEEFEVGTAARELIGSRIGRYKLLQEIGEGGFGIVYLADQLEPVKRRVALKVLKPGMDTREVVARFAAERQSLALMDHPNIARIFDGGQTESGRPYFVMELVKGVPLTKYCDDQQLNTRQRLDLFLDVLAAVQHAHQKGVIHRDLKPPNILVAPHDGRPVIKVIDFGIAKAISLELTDKTLFTAHGHMIGTPQYMSPEQAEINALDVDSRSDIYSLGVVLYELLTGRTPLDAKKLRAAAYAEIQRLIREEEPTKPSTLLRQLHTAPGPEASTLKSKILNPKSKIANDLDWIVMKCLEKDRARRYETANGFAADLRRHLENQPVTARPPSTGYLLSRFVRRHRFGFAAAAAVSAALLALAGIAATTRGLQREAAAGKIAEYKQNLRLASMVDYATAVKALDQDFDANRKGQQAPGVAGKSRWHEGVVLLTRSLERDPQNSVAALRLYETLRSRHAEKKDRLLFALNHELAVVSASFSPDGTRIVTASWDKSAQVWDATTGKAIGEPLRHRAFVVGASFSPDGTRIVTASWDKTAQVWNAATGKSIGEPLRHQDFVTTAGFSPDGSRIVTTSGDGTALIWNVATGQVIGRLLRQPFLSETEFLGVRNRLESANFSPDGTWIVTSTTFGMAQAWDAATGQDLGEPLHHELMPHEHEVKCANFSPDGTRIVTASNDKTARLWDATTGQPIGEPMRHESLVNTARFSPDGTRIVTASHDKTVRVWDATTGNAIGEPLRHEKEVRRANFSSDGTRIVTATNDNIALWDAATGQAIGDPILHDNDVNNARLSPDGSRIITVSNDNTVRVINAITGQIIGEPMRHEGRVNAASFSPDGTRIVAASNDRTARLWWLLTTNESKAISSITPEILGWARNISGLRYGEDGELSMILDAERIATIANPGLAPGPWADLARWINTPAPQRTIDPKSPFTLRQIAERERDFDGDGNVESLESALRYDPTLPLARLFLASALEKTDDAKESQSNIPQRAAFLRRYDLDALAGQEGKIENEELAVLWVRAANHLLKLSPETRIGVGPKPATAREEAAKAARKALELVPGLPAAEEVLKRS